MGCANSRSEDLTKRSLLESDNFMTSLQDVPGYFNKTIHTVDFLEPKIPEEAGEKPEMSYTGPPSHLRHSIDFHPYWHLMQGGDYLPPRTVYENEIPPGLVPQTETAQELRNIEVNEAITDLREQVKEKISDSLREEAEESNEDADPYLVAVSKENLAEDGSRLSGVSVEQIDVQVSDSDSADSSGRIADKGKEDTLISESAIIEMVDGSVIDEDFNGEEQETLDFLDSVINESLLWDEETGEELVQGSVADKVSCIDAADYVDDVMSPAEKLSIETEDIRDLPEPKPDAPEIGTVLSDPLEDETNHLQEVSHSHEREISNDFEEILDDTSDLDGNATEPFVDGVRSSVEINFDEPKTITPPEPITNRRKSTAEKENSDVQIERTYVLGLREKGMKNSKDSNWSLSRPTQKHPIAAKQAPYLNVGVSSSFQEDLNHNQSRQLYMKNVYLPEKNTNGVLTHGPSSSRSSKPLPPKVAPKPKPKPKQTSWVDVAITVDGKTVPDEPLSDDSGIKEDTLNRNSGVMDIIKSFNQNMEVESSTLQRKKKEKVPPPKKPKPKAKIPNENSFSSMDRRRAGPYGRHLSDDASSEDSGAPTLKDDMEGMFGQGRYSCGEGMFGQEHYSIAEVS